MTPRDRRDNVVLSFIASWHHAIVGITLFCPLWLHDTTESSKQSSFDPHGFTTPIVRLTLFCPSWFLNTTWPSEHRYFVRHGFTLPRDHQNNAYRSRVVTEDRAFLFFLTSASVIDWRGTERHGLESVSTPSSTSLTEGRFNLAQDRSVAWMSLWRLIPHRPRPPPPFFHPPPPLRYPPYSNVSRLEQSVIRLTSKKDAMPPGADCTIML